MKPQIISHRYLTAGKNKQAENTLTQLKAALAAGFIFFETDIRRFQSGDFYISHDPQETLTDENNAKLHMQEWKSHNCRIALNIKELGYEADLVKFLEEQGVISNVFLFDFDIEFLGADPKTYIENIHQLNPNLQCAVRVSDHSEPIDRALSVAVANIIWLDEFDSLWVKQEDMQKLKSAGKTVYCIAPDLHNFSHPETMDRFKNFILWEADGICTDFAEDLKNTLTIYNMESTNKPQQKQITKVAILLLNFNLPEMTDKLAEQISRNIKFPHELFLLDNGSEPAKRAKHATHVLEKNIGMNGGIQYLWDLVKDRPEFDGYWFLCNDIIFDEGKDYLQEMSALFSGLSQKFPVGSITPSYHFEGKEQAVPVFMKKQIGGTFRPIVWIEWNAILFSREFMMKFFAGGFGLKTKHAFQDVVSNYIGWKNGYGSFVMDNLSIMHLENQTFLKNGGKMVNGIWVPDMAGLGGMLTEDFNITQADFLSKGINLKMERKVLHYEIDVKQDYVKYLTGDYKPSLITKLVAYLKA